MQPSNDSNRNTVSRRNFIQKSSVAVAGALTALRAPHVHAASSEKFAVKIGLIGCGGRGSGALSDALGASTKIIYPELGYHTEDVEEGTKVAHPDIQVVALADLFEERINHCHGQLKRIGYTVPKEHRFVGFDAYEKLLAVPDINYVILATPPHFRPMHLKA